MKIDFLIIDPQQSFADPAGSLFVPGADADMDRLASLIDDVTPKINRIHVTLDQHHAIDISHPSWYASEHGDPAKAITVMTYDPAKDVFSGFCPIDGSTVEYRTRRRGFHDHTKQYIEALAASGRYPHTIWPEHCLIGDEGGTVHPAVLAAVQAWARSKVSTVNFVAKGSNPFTEHFSAVKAEVPQPNDPSTDINTAFVQSVDDADLTFFAGEALSHCMANTGRDSVAVAPSLAKKLVLLTDATSNVPGFEQYGTDFITDLTALGMRTMTCADARALINT
tara:strand:+ start:2636 stop:3475 length:840 start_codon:yes stop_codon:yes gene_type:complete